MSSRTDDLTASLVRELRAGSPEAGRAVDRLYREAIVRLARGYLGDDAEAEDAAQEVFLRVLTADTVPDRFRPWIYRVARNHCLNRVRSRRRRRDGARLPTAADFELSRTGPLSRLVKEEDAANLAARLAALPEDRHELLRLRYAEGLSRREIAEVLELTESVVKSRLFEAVKWLREES